jgi:hypothetical protein
MDWLLDLRRHDEVDRHADTILARLEDGTMPCDGPWDEGRVELFREWVKGGKAP